MTIRILKMEASYSDLQNETFIGDLQKETVRYLWRRLREEAERAGLQIYGDANVIVGHVDIPADKDGEGGWSGFVLKAQALVDTADASEKDVT